MSRRRWFLLRLVLAYLVVPLTGPLLSVLLMLPNSPHVALADWAGIVAIYSVFSFAAMVVFGIPLLLVYKRLHWTGCFAFIAGGALCAAATYLLVARQKTAWDQLVFFTLFGIVEGFMFRLVLFGVARHGQADFPASGSPEHV